MIHLFKRGDMVPGWLICATPMEWRSKRGTLTFGGLVLVIESPWKYFSFLLCGDAHFVMKDFHYFCISADLKPVKLVGTGSTLHPRGE